MSYKISAFLLIFESSYVSSCLFVPGHRLPNAFEVMLMLIKLFLAELTCFTYKSSATKREAVSAILEDVPQDLLIYMATDP